MRSIWETKIQLIWDDFSAGNISTKEAFDRINKRLRGASLDEQVQLFKLSERIMDSEIPLKDRNLDLEEAWWNATHKEEE